MQAAGVPFLTSWQAFCVIIGAAGATLTGLMFVATTLIGGMPRPESSLRAGFEAFATPTLVQFGIALLIAAILSAPWPALCRARIRLALVLAPRFCAADGEMCRRGIIHPGIRMMNKWATEDRSSGNEHSVFQVLSGLRKSSGSGAWEGRLRGIERKYGTCAVYASQMKKRENNPLPAVSPNT